MNLHYMNTQLPKMTRRERQAEALRNEILSAAVLVFNENGYEKATTKKIAEKAEVSEGTLYNYFNNKRDILITLFKNTIDGVNDNLKVNSSVQTNDIKKLLASGLTLQLRQLNSSHIMTLFLHEAKIDSEAREIFSEMLLLARNSAISVLENLEKEGKIRHINYSKMSTLMSIIGIGFTTLMETGDQELANVTLEELASDFADILVNGLNLTPNN